MKPNPILSTLYDQMGQSPWLDNLARPLLRDSTIKSYIDQGIRGITSNPTIFQNAIESTDLYDQQYKELRAAGKTNEQAYWELVKSDVTEALDLFAPLYEQSQGNDGFVSLEVSPNLAHDAAGTEADALKLIDSIHKPNLLIKVPATTEGLIAIENLTAAGHSINVTLIFGLQRYEQVIEAYLKGLERATGDIAKIRSVASFFISRVDTEIDDQLSRVKTEDLKKLVGRAATAQAVLAYRLFEQKFSGSRWEELEKRGAKVQRPLWASTSVKNPDYPNLMYIENLIAPNTVNTMPDATLRLLMDSGGLGKSDICAEGYIESEKLINHLEELGIDIKAVNTKLEAEGVEKFTNSFNEILSTLGDKFSS